VTPLRLRVDVLGAPNAASPPVTLLLLPPAKASADDFEREGFLEALNAHRIPARVLRSELPLDLYAGQQIVDLLREALREAAGPGQSRPIWVAGISLGGMTALACARDCPGMFEVVFAISPWPGPRTLWSDIAQAPSVSSWAAASHRTYDDERRVWRWLGQGTPGAGEVLVGWGRSDRFAQGQSLLASALAPPQRLSCEGGHDWDTYRTLWHQFLARQAMRLTA
jgi:pimeloyl-ACP methyl ester carboxylesterase